MHNFTQKVPGHFETDKYVFFYGGPFSNWYPCEYEYMGQKFNCSEQHLMAGKAIIFNDMETYFKILTEKNPREQKALGRSVANYDETVWEKYREGVMTTALYEKFYQNKDLQKILLDTDQKIIVEYGTDRVWGCGLFLDHKNILFRDRWPGMNLLGKSLMGIRNFLLQESISQLED